MPRVRVTRTRDERAHCPYCRGDLNEPTAPVRCAGCEARYHADCAQEARVCANIGCKTPLDPGRSSRRRARHPPPLRFDLAPPLRAENEALCPGCGDELRRARNPRRCTHCQARYHQACASTFARCRAEGCGGHIRPEPISPVRRTRRSLSARSASGPGPGSCALFFSYGAIGFAILGFISGAIWADSMAGGGHGSPIGETGLFIAGCGVFLCLVLAAAASGGER